MLPAHGGQNALQKWQGSAPDASVQPSVVSSLESSSQLAAMQPLLPSPGQLGCDLWKQFRPIPGSKKQFDS